MKPPVSRAWTIATGAFGIAFGIWAFLWPQAAVLPVARLLGIYVLGNSLLTLGLTLSRKSEGKRTSPSLAQALIGLAVGLVLVIFAGMTFMWSAAFATAWALVTAFAEISFTFFNRKAHENPGLLRAAGFLSLVFAFLVGTWSFGGLTLLLGWVGAYAALHGLLLVFWGIRLGRIESGAPASRAGELSFRT